MCHRLFVRRVAYRVWSIALGNLAAFVSYTLGAALMNEAQLLIGFVILLSLRRLLDRALERVGNQQ